MGKVYDEITPQLADWLCAQRVFFVGTAPLAGDGLVNCSPKGLDTFRILDSRTVAYLDLTGSGIETVAHLRENGRIVFMFCAFDGPPKIVRLHGKGEVVTPGDNDFEALSANFPTLPGARALIRASLKRISDSCGYAVPLMDFVGEREVLTRNLRLKGPENLAQYRIEKNSQSLDGLPGLVD